MPKLLIPRPNNKSPVFMEIRGKECQIKVQQKANKSTLLQMIILFQY